MSDATAPWIALALQSLRDPRQAIGNLLRMGLAASTGWQAIALTSVLTALFTHVTVALAPSGGGATGFPLAPVPLAVAQMALMALTVLLIDRIGRGFGGQGDWTGAVLLVAWVQVLLTALQAVQVLLLLAIPPLGQMLGLLGLVLMLWLMTGFIAGLHGFRALAPVLVAILVVAAGLVLALAAVVMLTVGPGQ